MRRIMAQQSEDFHTSLISELIAGDDLDAAQKPHTQGMRCSLSCRFSIHADLGRSRQIHSLVLV